MPTFQVEMRWRCSTCGKENLGRYKKCQKCGKPIGREHFYDAPGTETPTLADAVTDPNLVKQATAGSDWECQYCGSHQRRDSGECAECGSKQGDSREHETKWDDGKVGRPASGQTTLEELEAHDAEVKAEIEAEQVALARSIHELDQHQKHSQRSGSYREKVYVEPDPLPFIPEVPGFFERALKYPPKAPWYRKVSLLVALAATVLSVSGWAIFRTRIVDAQVTALSWQHIVHVERYQVIRDEGFDENRPGDAFEVRSVGMRHHHYDHVPDGTVEVPYTEQEQCGEDCSTTPVSCSDNGNGFKSCSGGDRVCSPRYCSRTRYRTETKYKDVSVEEMWYAWKAWRWRHNRDVVARGSTNEPYWPAPVEIRLNENLGSEAKEERESREALYEVTFTDTSKNKHAYKAKGLGDFQKYPMGTVRKLKVGIAHGVEVLPPG